MGILVVDDEPSICELLSDCLSFEGFEVDTAYNATDALSMAESQRYDLVILDIMLPDMNGIEVCKRLHIEDKDTPILFLTAKDSPADKVRGLVSGGDDYVTKPFNLEELVARVRVILKRTRSGFHPQVNDGKNSPEGSVTHKLHFADLSLDEMTYEVFRGDNLITLTATEFYLLHFLMSNPKRVLSKSQILNGVWQYDFDGDGNIVETYISYLRKKIDRFDPPLIHTVRGVGYILRLPPDKKRFQQK
ncbi:MAG: response regulator transcription factor [Actinobacteria bacterium]|nr:response regulator transcription factor [Actinomycetota bacterium]